MRMEKKEIGMETVGSSKTSRSEASASSLSSTSTAAETKIGVAAGDDDDDDDGRADRRRGSRARTALPAMRSRDASAGVLANRTTRAPGRGDARATGRDPKPPRAEPPRLAQPLGTSAGGRVGARTAAAGAAASIACSLGRRGRATPRVDGVAARGATRRVARGADARRRDRGFAPKLRIFELCTFVDR